MEAVDDLSSAGWVQERIVTFAKDVGSLVPIGDGLTLALKL